MFSKGPDARAANTTAHRSEVAHADGIDCTGNNALTVSHVFDAESGTISLTLSSHTGKKLLDVAVTSTSATVDPKIVDKLYASLSSSTSDLTAAREFLARVRTEPAVRMNYTPQPALLMADPAEIVALIDSELYFVPPSKARDSMLGTYTGASILSEQTLPNEADHWALISLDVVGLGRAERKGGDHVLKSIAPLAQKHFGDDLRITARDGGDEFVLLVRASATGASEVLRTKMEAFKADLKIEREIAFGISGEAETTRALAATLMRNAFRRDLQDWSDRCEFDTAEPTIQEFLKYMLDAHPELQETAISLDSWPAEMIAQEKRFQGVIRELFTGTSWHMHYYKRARELALKDNPLLDVRASITCYTGNLTPEVMQLMRAQNNYEIDRLKNDPYAPLVVSEFGQVASNPEKTFKRREGERLLADAVAAADREFDSCRAELVSLIENGDTSDRTFEIACRLARVTCQDAQNPLGTRYSLGEHLLEGHLKGLRGGESKQEYLYRYDLLDTGRWNNRLGPERVDEIVRLCCAEAAPKGFRHEDVHTDRVGGGEFWQSTFTPISEAELQEVKARLGKTYHQAVWSTHEKHVAHLTLLARLEKHGLEVLDEELTRKNVWGRFNDRHQEFPKVETSGPFTLTARAEETRRDYHRRRQELLAS